MAAITPFTALACPLDGTPLARQENSWCCARGHCYDVAAQGYVNLLPVQHKRSLDPGDSKEMVAARRRFLEAGHYQPIAAAVARQLLTGAGPLACLDAGCGEGYYLGELMAAAGERSLALLGLDISKWAVQAAARRCREVAWVVGSNAHLPVLPASLDRIFCMFGFPVFAEFARVLRPGGELLLVDAAPDHLRELREVIYPVLKPERAAVPELPPGFIDGGEERLRFGFELTGQAAIFNLLAMTPHLHRATAEGRARALALTRIALTADVRLRRLRHVPGNEAVRNPGS